VNSGSVFGLQDRRHKQQWKLFYFTFQSSNRKVPDTAFSQRLTIRFPHTNVIGMMIEKDSGKAARFFPPFLPFSGFTQLKEREKLIVMGQKQIILGNTFSLKCPCYGMEQSGYVCGEMQETVEEQRAVFFLFICGTWASLAGQHLMHIPSCPCSEDS